MLTEILRFIKLGFWKRFVIGIIVVESFTVFAKFPNLLVKLGAFVVFFATSSLIMPNIVSQFSSQIRVVRRHKLRATRPMPEHFVQLQNLMGVRLKEFATLPGKGAYTKGRCVVLGEESIRDLSFSGLMGVFAHELAHIRGRHLILRSIAAFILVLVPIYGWLVVSSPIFVSELFTEIIVQVMATIATIVFMTIAMVPINHKLEVRADRVAKKFVGEHAMVSALLNITEEKNHGIISETHPSISERVKLLRKLKTERLV